MKTKNLPRKFEGYGKIMKESLLEKGELLHEHFPYLNSGVTV